MRTFSYNKLTKSLVFCRASFEFILSALIFLQSKNPAFSELSLNDLRAFLKAVLYYRGINELYISFRKNVRY